MSQVNLDALIRREDLEIKGTVEISSNKIGTIGINQLKDGDFFYEALRKPDFQRETCEWTPEKVYSLIHSFLSDDLIPSIILWAGQGNIFVIDGAHRLSALIAWVQDDYGDGNRSKAFFDQSIPPEQKDFADRTRKLIKKNNLEFTSLEWAIKNQNEADPDLLAKAKKLASLSINLQWVPGNASKAELSFFKINEQATPINETEKVLLKSRRLANAIAARAIVHAGTGHKYWEKFSDENKINIQLTAKKINEDLFTPQYHSPVKTLDLPLAGRGYSSQTLALIFDLLNLTNDIKVDYRKKRKPEDELSEEEKKYIDENGELTIKLLKSTKKFLERLVGTEPQSLGLHPIVYFYSTSGRYQITAFLAVIEMVKDLELHRKLNYFIDVRGSFEDFLVKYKIIINQMTVKYGSGLKGFKQLQKLLRLIIDQLKDNKTHDEIIQLLGEVKEYRFLKPEESEIQQTYRKEFATETKSMIYIRTALEHPIRCKICNGYIHTKSITIDHIDRKQDGGLGDLNNGQLSHPYCNTTYKN